MTGSSDQAKADGKSEHLQRISTTAMNTVEAFDRVASESDDLSTASLNWVSIMIDRV
jgi:hypothetical protein